ncbi:MAG: tetratricopeptide repeat protein, partial [Cyanobacteria bacterium J06641_2]
MQILKISAIVLALGVVACSPKANSTVLQNSTQAKPESNSEPKSQLSQANFQDVDKYFNSGKQRFKKGDYQGAIADYTKAIKINPNYANAYSNRGFSRYKLKDNQGAISDFTKAIEINPNDFKVYNERGNARLDLKDYQQAIADYTKAIEINPNFAYAYVSRSL